MKYRGEIDGLRTLAVLPVILFHAGIEFFEGGFVGVDIFFVISGYLITSIILSDMKNERFSIVNFYERRARRILPALFFVMLCCLPFSWMWLLPDHLKDFSDSLMAVSVFSSNILFWQESGYFGVESELKPLLHTWSLAVEEQYYILFPLCLMLLWSFRKRWIFGALLLTCIVSLLLSQWGAYYKPKPTFFLLPTRLWELATGALIAFYFLYKKDHLEFIRSRMRTSEILGGVGFLLILYSIIAFDKNTPFPSFYALLPTVGTGLIIVFVSDKTIIGKLLNHKIMVGLGLISYSAYLWHQPLFAFARHRSLTEPSTQLLLFLSIVSIFFAYLSWKYIEKPFRDKNVVSRKVIFSFALVGSLFFASIGLAGNYYNGFPSRLSGGLSQAMESALSISDKRSAWHAGPDNYISPERAYMKTNKSGSGNNIVYLMGDSHAEAIAERLEQKLNDTKNSFMALTYSGCPPIKNIYRPDRGGDHLCYEFNNKTYDYIANDERIKTIIIMARWAVYLEGGGFDNGEGGVEKKEQVADIVVDEKKQISKGRVRGDKLREEYIRSLKGLISTGKNIILVYPVPEAGWNVPQYLAKYTIFNKTKIEELGNKLGSVSYQRFKARNLNVYEALDRLGGHPNLKRVYPENVFCNTFAEKRCAVHSGANIFYRDRDHLSLYGAGLLVDEIVERL